MVTNIFVTLPVYSTLMRKIQDFKFGIFTGMLELLDIKVQNMENLDRFCVLSYDEMVISEQYDYNKKTKKFVDRSSLRQKIT